MGINGFRWFWGKTTIGDNGFPWVCTIGPTMEWLCTIVEVYNKLYKLDGQRTFYISHLNCFSSECFLARQGGSKASSRGCCHAGFLSWHFAVFCNSNFAYLQVSCLDIKTLCLCYIFYIITLDLVVIVLIVSIHSYKLNLKIIPGFPGLSDWSAGGPGCLNRCEFQPRIFLSQLLVGPFLATIYADPIGQVTGAVQHVLQEGQWRQDRLFCFAKLAAMWWILEMYVVWVPQSPAAFIPEGGGEICFIFVNNKFNDGQQCFIITIEILVFNIQPLFLVWSLNTQYLHYWIF